MDTEKNGDIFSRKGATIIREDFERLKEEYYGLRGWDVASGLPTGKRLRQLDLEDIAKGLKTMNLLC